MMHLYPLVRPFLHAMDAEDAHRLAIRALAAGIHPKDRIPDDKRLGVNVLGLHFPNPVGIAAGFDKNAEGLAGLFSCGFGFVEAGTVTPRPQPGNARPRVFRDKHSKSVINRMGFPGEGADVFLDNYQKFRHGRLNTSGIVGINIGKNKDTEDPAADYLKLVTIFAPMADYLTVNISSPNTAGLRDLQKPDFLLPFIASLKDRRAAACGAIRQPPLLIKLAPDLNDAQCEDIAGTLTQAGIDGIILSNTTLDRPDTLPESFRIQTGGLSGPYVRGKSTAIIRKFYKLTKGAIPIIGVGGIASGADAYEKILAGASLVQLYTALVFEGPGLVRKIKDDLLTIIQRNGLRNIAEAIGADNR